MFTNVSQLYKRLAIRLTLFSIGWNFCLPVYADTARVQFSTSIGGRCQFGQVITGSLGLSTDGETLNSKINGGFKGSTNLVCNRFTRLQVDAPILSLFSDPFTIESSRTEVQLTPDFFGNPTAPETIVATDSSTPSFSSNAALLLSLGNNDIEVDMEVTNTERIPAGTYIFVVRLTAVAP